MATQLIRFRTQPGQAQYSIYKLTILWTAKIIPNPDTPFLLQNVDSQLLSVQCSRPGFPEEQYRYPEKTSSILTLEMVYYNLLVVEIKNKCPKKFSNFSEVTQHEDWDLVSHSILCKALQVVIREWRTLEQVA